MCVSIVARNLSKLFKAMRLRRAVPKIPAKFSILPRLPLNKSGPLPTRSESTLPQLLIPLHFNSCISNAYRKPGEGVPRSSPKVLQLVTLRSAFPRTCRNSRNSIPLIRLLHNSRTGRGWGIPAAGQICLSVAIRPLTGHGPRATAHRPQVPLRRKQQSARITVVSGLATSWETFPLFPVSKELRADIGLGIHR